MQPQDPLSDQPAGPPAPDLPDAALPSIEPVTDPPPQPSPPSQPFMPQPTTAAADQPVSDSSNDNSSHGKNRLSGIGKKFFKYIEFDDEEILLAEIRKHQFGLFIILTTGVLIALAIFAGVTILASANILNSLGFGNFNAVLVFAGFLLSILVIIITMVNAHLYRNNVVFVTNEKLAQVLFITLFNRKISQLGIGDVQDVTVQQNGFLPNLVGYGTLVVETAGEQQNYTFTFVPKPYETSKVIISAHEGNLKKYGN